MEELKNRLINEIVELRNKINKLTKFLREKPIEYKTMSFTAKVCIRLQLWAMQSYYFCLEKRTVSMFPGVDTTKTVKTEKKKTTKKK